MWQPKFVLKCVFWLKNNTDPSEKQSFRTTTVFYAPEQLHLTLMLLHMHRAIVAFNPKEYSIHRRGWK